MGLFAAGALSACAHNNSEAGASTSAMAEPAATANAPAPTVASAAPATATATATAETGQTALHPKCTVERRTGQFQRSEGQVYRPEGTYGSMARIEVRGSEGVREEVGTYTKPEGSFSRPEAVVVNPQGRYVQPFGSQPQALAEGSLKNERLPVAGHDIGYFIVKGPRGNDWQVDDPKLIRQAEERMQAAGVNPGAVDGVADEKFGAALVKFQQRNGLSATGVIDEATARALGLDWHEVLTRVHHDHHPETQAPAPRP
jgi:hypothetical protein